MLRHRDLFEQLHAAGLVMGPATILVLLASLASGSAEILTSALLVVVFILVTSSLSTHVVALAGWRQRETSRHGAHTGAGVDAADSGAMRTGMRLLVAHDGSPGSDTTVALAGSLVWPAGTRVRLVAVTEGDLPALPDQMGASPSAVADEAEPPRRFLSAAARALERPGLEVEVVTRAGDPAMAIASEAEAMGADLVLVGSRGLGRIRSMLTGSVAAGVVDRAPCPVLVARAPQVRRVLLAADGSATSAAATEAVARWPMFGELEIQVLSVTTLAESYRELPPMRTIREARGRLRQQRIANAAVVRLRSAGLRAAPFVQHGDAASRIVAFAEARSVDLVVIGSRGHTGVRRTLLGSVARDVLAAAEASVLIVRSR
jgi:nucleotide-binding universal stress UspA family protein